ncbi:hypothetical protein ACLQ26_26290 [Micromonospora sp. DT43]|uniref:hypothetical protein n=1 Tax=Micromonospora sp. DT43 TaxID=3393440 RepID=UPI003CFA0B29
MTTARRGLGEQPQTLHDIALALDAASPADVETCARLFDDARRVLRAVAESFDRALGDLDDSWRSTRFASVRLGEPLRRTRQLVHALDEAECGQQLRVTANALGAGQARIRELRAQRAADTGPEDVWDHQARVVLQGLSETYRDVGLGLGGQSPPAAVTVDEPGISRALAASARGDLAEVVLAADSDAVDLFRPAAPTIRAGQPGEAVSPPPGGGGGGGGGYPMMPFMPMGGGMGGGMGAGMGGMGGMGGTQYENGGQRRGSTLAQGDAAVWKDADAGWNVLGRKDVDQHIREGLRKELGDAKKGDGHG